MRYLKIFEDFKVNNITEEDIVNVIKNDGVLFTNSIKNLPDHIDTDPVKPVNVEGDVITLDIDGEIYQTSLEFIERIED